MPDLYVSALGVPFRAVVAQSGGERAFVKIADRPDDDFGLDPAVWIDSDGATTGAQAVFLERSGHYGEFYRVTIGGGAANPEPAESQWNACNLLAVVLRRLIAAAELQSGESVQRVVLVVPATIAVELQSEILRAALLAGAQNVEFVSLDQIVADGTRPSGSANDVALIAEGWDDVTRVTAVAGTGTPAATRVVDISAVVSRQRVRASLLERFGAGQRPTSELDAEIADQVFNVWASGKDVSRGHTITRAARRAAPVTVHVPASTFARLDDALRERLDRCLREHDIEPERIGSVDVIGSWTRPLAQALRSLVSKQIRVRDERGAELDAAIKLVPPQARAAKPSLSSEILAIPESSRTLRALSQGEPISLLRPGMRLPATSVSENFNSSSFMKRFSIAAKTGGTVTPLISIAIPRYAERQRNSYLRTVVHSETSRFVLIEVAYLYSTQRRFAIYDRTAAVETPVADHLFRIIRG